MIHRIWIRILFSFDKPLKANKFGKFDKATKFITPLKLKLITPLRANKFDKDSF